MKNSLKNGLIITTSICVVTIIYFTLIYNLKCYYITSISKNATFKSNEFADFIGGLLNPLFTLLSTVSIIFLTYIVAKGDNRKAEKAIETQKRITLNQMRQTALENLIQKTNLYVYERDKLSFYTTKSLFHQRVLTKLIEEEIKDQEKVTVWLIILCELENFTQLKYLFSKLFENEDFNEKYTSIIDVASNLCKEQDEFKFVKNSTIEKYINIQQEFLTMIGNYIYSEF